MLVVGILLCFGLQSFSQKNYSLIYILSNRDTLNNASSFGLKNQFLNRSEASKYALQIMPQLYSKGFAGASVDSISWKENQAIVFLFTGEPIFWGNILTDSIDLAALQAIRWNQKWLTDQPMRFPEMEKWTNKLLDYYANNGYPFAKIYWKNVAIEQKKLNAQWVVDKGILYHLDSIRIYGTAKINNLFLQKYLSLQNGSIYNQEKINEISKKIQDLPFLQELSPPTVTMLGSGAILNLYLAPKRSSQIDVLIGFMPGNSTDNQSRLIADVNLNLKNTLSNGENIILNWQQLQPQSPRLNLGYIHPFIFRSNFGFNGQFKLFKQDSSYLELQSKIGIQYFITSNQTIGFFYQFGNNYLLSGGLDTNQIKVTKKLPRFIDVASNSFGIDYHFNSTDYRFNPRNGYDIQFSGTAGIRNVKPNDDIIQLKDLANPSFDFRSLYDSIQLKSYRVAATFSGARFFPLGKNSVLKTALNGGIIESAQLFQNELFRIGGYRILRGFDEESILANRYGVLTLEYRYLLGPNSYFSLFSDGALTYTKWNNNQFSNSFISLGLGLEFETKLGLLNISYAVGKRNDVKFDFRSASKIHFGYINYF